MGLFLLRPLVPVGIFRFFNGFPLLVVALLPPPGFVYSLLLRRFFNGRFNGHKPSSRGLGVSAAGALLGGGRIGEEEERRRRGEEKKRRGEEEERRDRGEWGRRRRGREESGAREG